MDYISHTTQILDKKYKGINRFRYNHIIYQIILLYVVQQVFCIIRVKTAFPNSAFALIVV